MGLVLGKGDQGHVPPLVLQGDFSFKVTLRSELGRKVQREQIGNAVHTPDWTFKANFTLTACCAFRIRLILSPRAVSYHLLCLQS